MLTSRKPNFVMVTVNYYICFSRPERLIFVEFMKSFGVSKVIEEELIKESTCNIFNEPPPI